MFIYFLFAMLLFIVLQIFIIISPYNKKICKVMNDIFGDNTLVGSLYGSILDIKNEEPDPVELSGLAAGFFLVWALFSLVAVLISVIWPITIFLLLFILLFNIKKPIKK